MQKTKEISFEGSSATISSDYAPKKVSVTVKDPDVDEIFESLHHEDRIGWIQGNYKPDDVFTDSQLRDWAYSNGYIKE